MSEIPDSIIIDPPGPAEASVIWLHGLGADGHDFEGIVPHLGLPGDLAVRFVFPHAPQRPVTVNGGMVMRAWFDIVEMNLGQRQDESGIRESAELLSALVERERGQGVAAERIVLAGFSQGGAVALHTGLRHPERLAGIMALSSYLPLAERIEAERHAANLETPIFMAHGTADPVVPLAAAEKSKRTLVRAGYSVEFRTYPMPHSVIPEEIVDISAWLNRALCADAQPGNAPGSG